MPSFGVGEGRLGISKYFVKDYLCRGLSYPNLRLATRARLRLLHSLLWLDIHLPVLIVSYEALLQINSPLIGSSLHHQPPITVLSTTRRGYIKDTALPPLYKDLSYLDHQPSISIPIFCSLRMNEDCQSQLRHGVAPPRSACGPTSRCVCACLTSAQSSSEWLLRGDCLPR